MGPITMVCGAVLVALGVGGYVGTNMESTTALIPAYFGGGLVVLGGLALQDKMRKHAMHLAAMVGLIGAIGALVMVVMAAASGEIKRPVAFGMQVGMAVVCAVFVGLCVKSFIDARRARQAREAQAGTPVPQV